MVSPLVIEDSKYKMTSDIYSNQWKINNIKNILDIIEYFRLLLQTYQYILLLI